jgi:acyl carrier protein
MVPAAFVILDALPLTPNGKIDRKALAALEIELWGAQDRYVAPETPLQEQLVALWAAVLKRPVTAIGITHNFFELGGHSLLAVQIIARVRRDFQVELPIRMLMENPTVAGMADALQHQLLLSTISSTATAADQPREVIEL